MERDTRPEWLEVWHMFLQAHALLVQQLGEEMESEQALPLAWFDVLIQLSFVPEGRLRMHELRNTLMLTRSGVTRRIDRMESGGLVRREQCAGDARGVVVALTDLGRTRLAEAKPAHARRVYTHFARHLTQSELDTLHHSLEKILTSPSEGTPRTPCPRGSNTSNDTSK